METKYVAKVGRIRFEVRVGKAGIYGVYRVRGRDELAHAFFRGDGAYVSACLRAFNLAQLKGAPTRTHSGERVVAYYTDSTAGLVVA